ncbi:GlcG/HbpS family heme-binding protein [Frateuria aurantia]
MTQSLTHSLQSLSLSAAEQLCQAAIEAAHRHRVLISVTVVDAAGQLLAFQRMDRAVLISIDVSIGKARTAAILGKSATIFEQMINQGHPSLLSIPGLMPLAGGVPVTLDGHIVGAIGISGASGDVDEAIAIQVAQSLTEVFA